MMLCSIAPFAIVWFRFYSYQVFGGRYSAGINLLPIVIFAVLSFIFTLRYTWVWLELESTKDLIYSQILATLISDFLIYIVIALLIRALPDIPTMLRTLVFQVALIVVVTLIIKQLLMQEEEQDGV